MDEEIALGPRGRQIWKAYDGSSQPAGKRALIQEAARMADNLDKLNDLVVGRQDTWAELVFDQMGVLQIYVDKLLSEQRQLQIAFKQIMAEIRQAGLKDETEQSGSHRERGATILDLRRNA